MKKILCIIAILFSFATTYAQETKPTKQETMDWIGKTLLKYRSPSGAYENYKYSYGILTYDYYSSGYLYKYTIYLSKILAWDYFDNNGFEARGYNSEKQVTYDLDSKKSEVYSSDYFGLIRIGTGNGGSGNDAFYFVNENNIRERFSKALANLVEYNKQELPKEAY